MQVLDGNTALLVSSILIGALLRELGSQGGHAEHLPLFVPFGPPFPH